MFSQVTDFAIANWYACVCLMGLALNLKIGEQRMFTGVIAGFSFLCLLLHYSVKVTGPAFYVIWSMLEILMVLTLILVCRVFSLRVNFHVLLASLASTFFVVVNIFRMADRYLGENLFTDWYSPLVLLVYYVYAFIVLSPAIGVGLIYIDRRLKGFFYNDSVNFSVIRYIGNLCLFGCVRHPKVYI